MKRSKILILLLIILSLTTTIMANEYWENLPVMNQFEINVYMNVFCKNISVNKKQKENIKNVHLRYNRLMKDILKSELYDQAVKQDSLKLLSTRFDLSIREELTEMQESQYEIFVEKLNTYCENIDIAEQ